MLKTLIVCLIVSIIYSEAKLQHTDNPAITFRYNEIHGNDYKVDSGKPLDIVLDNFFANVFWCLSFYYTGPKDQFVNHVSLNGSSDAVIHVPNITEAMLTKWWCVILQNYNTSRGKFYQYRGQKYTAYNLVFILHDSYSIDKTAFDKKIIYLLSGIAIIILLLICTIVVIKKCFCQKSNLPLQLTVDPASVFYGNLEIFRREYERQVQEQEPEYEEI